MLRRAGWLLLAAGVVLAIAIGVVIVSNRDQVPVASFNFPTGPIHYTYYRPDDGANDEIKRAIGLYQAAHPNVSVELKVIGAETYQQLQTEALAFAKPPDLFTFDAAEFTAVKQHLAAAPTESFSSDEYTKSFHPIAQIALTGGKLYAVPFSIKPYVLLARENDFKQQDLTVPGTWNAMVAAAPKLRVSSASGLTRGEIALGTANLRYEPDILSLLIFQNGGSIFSADLSEAVFAGTFNGYKAGTESLKFFGAFADPSKATYSFNSFEPKLPDAFTQGKVSAFVGTQADENTLRKSGTSLGVYPMVQVDGAPPRNFVQLPLEGVTLSAPHPEVAWDLLHYLASKRELGKIEAAANILSPRLDLMKTDQSRYGPYIAELDHSSVLIKLNVNYFDTTFRRIVTRYFSGVNPQFVMDDEQKKFTEYLRSGLN